MKISTYIDSKFDDLGLTPAQRFAVNLHIMISFSGAIGHVPYIELGGRIYPNLCMVLIGETGKGKGRSCNFAKEIFSGYGEDVAAPLLESTRVYSMKTLLRDIHAILSEPVRATRGEIRINHINEEFVTELRSAASSYLSGLSSIICKLVDGAPINETFGRQKISYPLVHYSFMGHIQPGVLQSCMRSHLIETGFANRILWFELPREMTAPLPPLSQEIKTELADDIEESVRFARNMRSVPLSEEALSLYLEFTTSIAEEQSTTDEVMRHMLPRFGQNVLKLALVLSMLRRERVVEAEAISQAIDLINSTRTTVKAYLTTGSGDRLDTKILNLLRNEGPMSPARIRERFLSTSSLTKINKSLTELQRSALIKLVPIDRGDGTFPQCFVPSSL